MHFPPIPNGLDYLRSVVDHLTGEPDARDLKYAVLHLQAATEVLLKARLQREHWSLVLKEPGRADRAKFDKGEFESCSTTEAVTRLRGIVGVKISEKDTKEIDKLAKTRNALQHYGLTDSAHAIEARAAKVLDILLDFITEHLMPGLRGEDANHAEEAMDDIRGPLNEMKSFIKTRMDRLSSELQPHAEKTVACPDCRQFAMVADIPLTCRFCGVIYGDKAEALAVDYVEDVLGEDRYFSSRDDGLPPVRVCPGCGSEALVLEAHTAASPGVLTPLCLCCGARFDDLRDCIGGCANVLTPDEPDLCPDCIDATFDRH
jgi:hypothetical protein